MEENMEVESGIGFSISGGNSRIQEKILAVQQVVTLLEDTMSSAKSKHQQRQAGLQSRIDELELQIQNVRNEMERDSEDFSGVTTSLEDDIQQYLNLENKLLTIEERSQDDYVVLPETSSRTDILVGQFLQPKYNEWQNLKSICHSLNQSTQKSYKNKICAKRYKVMVESSGENSPQLFQAIEKANALNLFRGKKCVATSPASISSSRFVSLTWYKDEIAARDYALKNYRKIIEQVFKDQYEDYRSRIVDIIELQNIDDINSPILMTESTIHVQPKTSSILNTHSQHCMPRRITLYQFDEATVCIPPALTTFSVKTAPSQISNIDSEIPFSSSVPAASTSQRHSYSESTNLRETNRPKNFRRKTKIRCERIPSKNDVLSLIGLGDSSNESSRTAEYPTPIHIAEEIDKNNSMSQVQTESIVPSGDNPVTVPDNSVAAISIISELATDYMKERGIAKLTNAQEQVIHSLQATGDVLYEGVANAGKTTGIIVSLLNCVDLEKDSVQALIITPNSRSSKRVQKAAEFIGERHIVLCQRAEQLLDMKDPKNLKVIKKPTCHILVGTLEEMKVLVIRNLVRKAAIRFLILHKAEEIYGLGNAKPNETALSMNQILYALDATIKVIVIRRAMIKCPELEIFCERKLRQTQKITETVDMAEFTIARRRNLSGGKMSSVSSEAEVGEYSHTTPEEPDKDEPADQDEELECATLISERGLDVLGISSNIDQDKADGQAEDAYKNIDITHLYAIMGDDGDSISTISVLNLEEDFAIIFCDSIERAESVSTRLRQKKLWPQVLHEGVSLKEQDVILKSYRQGVCRILICTDFVSSISLDSADIVVNFDVPKSKSSYKSRAAFAVRRITNSKVPVPAVIINLVVKDMLNGLKDLGTSLGIEIKSCDDQEASGNAQELSA